MNFFSFNFALREYFFCTSPAPPPISFLMVRPLSGSYVPCTISHVISFEKRTLRLISDVLADDVIGLAEKWWPFYKNTGSCSPQCRRCLPSPIFLCHKIKDSGGAYNNMNIHEQLSSAQNTPALHFRLRFLEQALPLSLSFALYPSLFAPTTQVKGIYALKAFAAGNIVRKTPFEAG